MAQLLHPDRIFFDDDEAHEAHPAAWSATRLRPRGDKTVLFDVDGVLFDWIEAFEPWARRVCMERNGYSPPASPTLDGDLRVWMFPDDPAAASAPIAAFQASPMLAGLRPYPDALEYLPRIRDLGFDPIAITSPGLTDEIVEIRLAQLERHFPGIFAEVHVLPLLVSKEKVLETFPASIWVDDVVKHVNVGRKLGHRGFHMDRGRTSTDPDPVADFGEIFEMMRHGPAPRR